jgi:hypothetical protein
LFKIADGIYTSVVYLENPNVSAGAKNVPYSFKLYEASQPGVLLAEREGVIDVYPEKGFPIIETKIYTGKRTAGRVVFNIDAKSAKWEKMSARDEKVVVKDQQISSEDTAPRVVANVENIGNIPASNIDVVAVVFDINGNAIGASRTFVESLARGEKQQVSFTWPEPFASKSAKVDLYVRTNAIQY